MNILMAMQGAVVQGLLWGIMVLGVYITYKILDVADLTVDGSFALGGAVCAVVTLAGNPILGLILGFAAGLAAGIVTGFLHTVLGIPAILSGILTQISLWSINLRIMGKANISMGKTGTVFTGIQDAIGFTGKSSWVALGFGIVIAVIIIILLYIFFGTEVGSEIRATGNNEFMVRALGGNTKTMKMIGLALANGLVGLSGALIAQYQKYADISMGKGAIVIGLAAIVIGGVLMAFARSFWSKLISAVVGAIIYFIIRAIVLQLGLDANDMQLISAIIVIVALAVPVYLAKRRARPKKA